MLNRFAEKLGVDTSKLAFCDVFGLDEVTLGTVHPFFSQSSAKAQDLDLTASGVACDGATPSLRAATTVPGHSTA